ncbi:site-specific integrase [Acetatifactor aquisgranensis]|uniref:site-specific integrase n=1 Tax=Acetatifactor aquisgranensis TaxID=2941233 RepID=UPI00203BBD16|nr:site-specific integrase [Acetatifactor aquisgranensis]
MPAYKYTLKDGKTTRWYANFYFTDWTGAKKHVCKRGFKTQREAKEYERSFLDQQGNASDILFSSLVENYLEDMSHRLKPTTMANKRNIIETKLLPYFGSQKVCDIDTIKIRKWQNELMSYRDDDGNPFSQTYLKTINNQLSAIMNYATAHYRLPANPCRVAGSMGRSKAEEMNIWTQAQYEQFSAAIQKSSVKLAFDILFYTGMRSGELLALTPADILPSRRIDINKNYAKINGEELFLEPKTPKAKRCISIPEFLYDDIMGYVSKLYGIGKGDRIFYFTKSALDKEIKANAAKAGLPPIRVHDLRHSHASMLIEMGFAPLEIADRLGHESVKTTLDTYSHLYPDKDQQLANRLNQFRRAAPPTEENS